MATLWHGRFGGGPDQILMAYTASIGFDVRLAAFDIEGSRAHARGLQRAGILSSDECGLVLDGLDTVAAEIADGSFVFTDADEDIHTAVERRLTELAGDAGARIHTGRSRNDQVATDVRLFARDATVAVAGEILELQQVLLNAAIAAGDAYLPGYTHLQRAQPVLLAHHVLAHFWALARDVDRLCDTHRRMNISPLGAGALAGSSLALDPEATAADLGFAGVFDNSLDAVSDRDFVAELVFDLALCGVHLSRIGEEVVLFSSEEFGFLRLDDAWSTGSSMLPQKKNPDVAELARGKTGRLIGDLTTILVVLKGLPLAYNRDLQEDKEPLFDAVDQVGLGVRAIAGLLQTATFDTEAMARAADSPTAAATDLAEYLVGTGMPFRQAHGVVGALVRRSLAGEGTLAKLVESEPTLGSAALPLLAPGRSVTQRVTRGGAGPVPVAEQRERAVARLAADRARVDELVR